MATIRDELILDLSQAIGQLDDLERQLDSLLQPIEIPVTIDDSGISTRSLDRAEAEVEDVTREVRRLEDAFDDTEREVKDTEDSIRRFGTRGSSVFSSLSGSLVALGGAFAAIQGGRALLGFFGDAIDAASDLEESTSKAQVVFGDFFGDIERFASTAPQALGLANQEALEFTGTFGNLFVALGLSQQAAADLSPEIVQLGADLASFNNLEVTDALDKLRAGLVGEAEPLRTLGVNLNAAATAAKAVELGLADSTTAVSDAAKVQARYALILEQTQTAQGDVARTSDSIANQQRTLNAEIEKFRTEVGEALVPAFQKLLDIAPSIISALEDGIVPALASLGSAIDGVDTDGFARAIAGLPSALGTVGTGVSSTAQAFGNALQVFGALARLDFTDVGTQFDQLGDDLQRLQEAPAANAAIQNLLTTLQLGTDPVEALNAVLVELGESVSGLTLETFERLIDQLIAITLASGGSRGELAGLIGFVTEFGEQAGFSAAGVEAMVNAIREALGVTGQLPPDVNELRDALEGLPETTTRSAQGLTEFGDSLSRLVSQDVDFGIDQIRAGIEELPGALDAASAALRDEENDTVSDFSDFLDNLDDEIAARSEFRRNIALLESLGFDDLAETFRDEGLDAAEALADALANPEEAARAEQLLDAAAERQATEYVTAFGATVGERLAALSPPEFEVIPVLGALDTSSLQFLNVNVGAGAPGGGRGEAPIIINQTFENTPTPTTETARAAQSARAIITRS